MYRTQNHPETIMSMDNNTDNKEYWQNIWKKEGLFQVEDSETDPTYILGMMPHTSGEVHMGHVRNHTIADAYARYRRMRNDRVLHPIGWDSFGLQVENDAKNHNVDPSFWNDQCIRKMRNQMQDMAFSFDWERELSTSDSDFYRWSQWLFKRLYEADIAERSHKQINWCPEDETALADEQVNDNKCYQCGTTVEKRPQTQWFLKTTEFAEDLLNGLETLPEWPDNIKQRQRKWIGRREGVKINFRTDHNEPIEVFTKRIDRLFGATFLAISPQHSLTHNLEEKDPEIRDFIDSLSPDREEKFEAYKTDITAEHPCTGEELPVYVADYVLDDLGTGAVMGTPGHDVNDHQFADANNIDIRTVIKPENPNGEIPYTGEGILQDSGKFTGLNSGDAQEKMLSELDFASQHTDYRLRDWCVSRQRYWGTPIPVVYCDDCGEVLVPDEELPLKLPNNKSVDENPLLNDEYIQTNCPQCGKNAQRETDTLDSFFDSAWYFLRFLALENESPFDSNQVSDWLPVDHYVVSEENAVGHLLYVRFIANALADIGLIDHREPIRNLVSHGLVLNNGTKMSRSEDNTISLGEYGVDTTRLFILGAVKPESDFDWSNHRRDASYTLQNEMRRLVTEELDELRTGDRRKIDEYISNEIDYTVQKVTNYYNSMEFYEIVKEIQSLYSTLSQYEEYTTPHDTVFHRGLKDLVLMMAPITPYLGEELWNTLGDGLVSGFDQWPDSTQKMDDYEKEQQIVEAIRSDIRDISASVNRESWEIIEIVVAPKWKYEALEIACNEDGNVYDTIIDKFDGHSSDKNIEDYAKYLAENSHDLEKELPPEREREVLERASWLIEKEFDAEVKILSPENASNKLCERARPAKAAISVK